jgi:hypothetical protein
MVAFQEIQDTLRYFMLFDTMCGSAALRRRFDGEPTEMQKTIGDRVCGTDYTVDFLFGFAGHEYRKSTDTAKFKDEVITSIDAGRPIIAKVKSNISGLFRVITGYDGNKLLCPDYKNAGNPPKKAPRYDELEALYIIGKKIKPRYVLKDSL